MIDTAGGKYSNSRAVAAKERCHEYTGVVIVCEMKSLLSIKINERCWHQIGELKCTSRTEYSEPMCTERP